MVIGCLLQQPSEPNESEPSRIDLRTASSSHIGGRPIGRDRLAASPPRRARSTRSPNRTEVLPLRRGVVGRGLRTGRARPLSECLRTGAAMLRTGSARSLDRRGGASPFGVVDRSTPSRSSTNSIDRGKEKIVAEARESPVLYPAARLNGVVSGIGRLLYPPVRLIGRANGEKPISRGFHDEDDANYVGRSTDRHLAYCSQDMMINICKRDQLQQEV